MASSVYASTVAKSLSWSHPCRNSLCEPDIQNNAVTNCSDPLLKFLYGFLPGFAQATSDSQLQHMNTRITKENNNEITNENSVGGTTQGKTVTIRF